jgi:hypothetical protein
MPFFIDSVLARIAMMSEGQGELPRRQERAPMLTELDLIFAERRGKDRRQAERMLMRNWR